VGAITFVTTASGGSAEEAFRNARDDAFSEYGGGGYTGSIAEKCEFVPVAEHAMAEGDAEAYAHQLLAADDPRIAAKRGAGRSDRAG
jgi:hypothetical protein